MSRVLVISYSDLSRDSRIDRQLGFLKRRHEVTAAGFGRPSHEDVAYVELGNSVGAFADVVRKCALVSQLVRKQYERAYWRRPENRVGLARLEGERPDLVVANDVASLPLAFRVANGAPVVFDAHELATAEWAHLRWWRLTLGPYIDGLLRSYLPRVDQVMTVSPGIAAAYEERYGIERPTVVTNAPDLSTLEPTPVDHPIRLIHHGIAEPQRRLELMIEAVDGLQDRYTLDLMLVPGNAAYLARLRRMCRTRHGVNVIGPRPQREIVRYCNGYDVGVFVLPPLNDNSWYALPNKIFEFIQARLAVVVGPSPEMANLVRARKLGVVTDDFTAEALKSALARMTREDVPAFKLASHTAAAELNSARNAEIVLDLVDQALSRRSAPVRGRP